MKTPKLPRGVTIRRHKNVESLQIFFSYKGVGCREPIRLPPTPSNITFAKNKRGAILLEIERGTFRYGDYFPNSKAGRRFGHTPSHVTVGKLLEDFLATCEKTREASTVRGYKIAAKTVSREFGSVRVQDLSPAMLRTWLASLPVTAKRVRNILTPLRSVLEQAVNDDLIPANPLDKVVLNKLLGKATRESTYEVDPFSKEEIAAILEAADGQARNLFQFAFYSGLRSSELIALKWGDVDWINGVVRVSRAVVEKATKGTKTKAGTREVTLSADARAALERQKTFTLLAGGEIFHNPRTKRPWETDAQIRKTCWTRLLLKAGVRYRNPYQTRHTYASTLLSAGENAWWVAQQMGHENVEMVMRHYGKWLPDHSKKPKFQSVTSNGTTNASAQSVAQAES